MSSEIFRSSSMDWRMSVHGMENVFHESGQAASYAASLVRTGRVRVGRLHDVI
jgi:hypothetical protein